MRVNTASLSLIGRSLYLFGQSIRVLLRVLAAQINPFSVLPSEVFSNLHPSVLYTGFISVCPGNDGYAINATIQSSAINAVAHNWAVFRSNWPRLCSIC